MNHSVDKMQIKQIDLNKNSWKNTNKSFSDALEKSSDINLPEGNRLKLILPQEFRKCKYISPAKTMNDYII